MNTNNDGSGLTCGCGFLILAANLLFGGWSVDLLVDVIFHANAPFALDVLAGIFLGQFTIPAALVALLLQSAGVI